MFTFKDVSCILQAFNTGTFLAFPAITSILQVVTRSSESAIIGACSLGFAFGLLLTGIASLLFLRRLSNSVIMPSGSCITLASWIAMAILIQTQRLSWQLLMLLETTAGFGTALAYIVALRMISGDSRERRRKIITMSLFLAIGGFATFMSFLFIRDIVIVLALLVALTVISGLFSLVMILNECCVIDFGEEEEVLIGSEYNEFAPRRSRGMFIIFLVALGLTFGPLLTYVNITSALVLSLDQNINPLMTLILFNALNIFGRMIGFMLESHLRRLPLVFGICVLVSACLFAMMYAFMNIWIVIITLIVDCMIFGLMWSVVLPIIRKIYYISESYAFGIMCMPLSLGPGVFGPLCSWILQRSGKFDTFIMITSMAHFTAAIAFIIGWFKYR
jgi:hypothetical protein